jgi:tetratricopeptide (TPR) repeat protein
MLTCGYLQSANAECNLTTTDNTWHAGLDYNDTSAETRRFISQVEEFHFTSSVETLREGSSGEFPIDIEYTLNSVPNHYRALATYAAWELKNPIKGQARARTAECYFQRAFGFRPDDPKLHLLYGTFLHRSGRLNEAATEYKQVEIMGLNTADYFYNRGLLEVDLGDLDAAREFADKAYSMGYPLPGLRNKLANSRRTGH